MSLLLLGFSTFSVSRLLIEFLFIPDSNRYLDSRYKMLLLNLLEKMDLESSQKEILKQVIVKSCLTTASFKLMTDEQLMAIGFPLPAVIEMKSILANEAQVLTPVSSNTPTSLSLGRSASSSQSTPVRTEPEQDFNAESLKELAAHIDMKSVNGLKMLTRLLVDELVKVDILAFYNFGRFCTYLCLLESSRNGNGKTETLHCVRNSVCQNSS